MGPRSRSVHPKTPKKPRNHAKQKLSTGQEENVIEHVKRWVDRGFPVSANKVISQVANAYLQRNPHGERETVAPGWESGLFRRYSDFEKWFLSVRDQNKHKGSTASREDKFVDFLHRFDELKQKHGIEDDNVWCVGDLGFVVNVNRETQARTVDRPETENAQKNEWRELASIIYCVPCRGNPLSPQVVYKTNGTRSRNWEYHNRIKFFFNGTGWCNSAIALDWLKMFDSETKPQAARDQGSFRRMLLVDARFPVDAEFEMSCWYSGIVCLCLPRKSHEIYHPLYHGMFASMDRGYRRHMKQRLRDRHSAPATLDEFTFADFVSRKLPSYSKLTAETIWRKSCLIPKDEDRLRQRIGVNVINLTDEDGANGMEQMEQNLEVLVPSKLTHESESDSPQSPVGEHDSDFEPPSSQSTPQPERSKPFTPSTHKSASDDDLDDSDKGDEPDKVRSNDTLRTPSTVRSKRSASERSGPNEMSRFQDCLDEYDKSSGRERKRKRRDMILMFNECRAESRAEVRTLERVIQQLSKRR